MKYNMIFVLGYDLLQDYLKEKELACDEAFNECEKIYEEFLKSDYDNANRSEYDCLYDYVNEVVLKSNK